jgi:hypothetical protein
MFPWVLKHYKLSSLQLFRNTYCLQGCHISCSSKRAAKSKKIENHWVKRFQRIYEKGLFLTVQDNARQFALNLDRKCPRDKQAIRLYLQRTAMKRDKQGWRLAFFETSCLKVDQLFWLAVQILSFHIIENLKVINMCFAATFTLTFFRNETCQTLFFFVSRIIDLL